MRIAIAGDLALRTPGLVADYASDDAFQAVRQELRASTVAVGNLEVPLSCRGLPTPKTFSLRADPAVVADVRGMGFHAVTLANNHIMDYGPDALMDTISACDRAGLRHCGADVDLASATAPLWFTSDGQRVALLNIACTVPMGAEALPERPGIAPVRVRFSFELDVNLLAEQPGTMPMVESWAVDEDVVRFCQSIAMCREDGADAVLVAIHWGSPAYWLSPYQGLLCAYQRQLGQALIVAGADAVVGHHAHQLHPIEVHQGKPILYCLGNCLFEGIADYPWMEPEAVIARLTFGAQPECALIPLVLDTRGVPRRATGRSAEAVFDKLRRLSEPFGTPIASHDEIGIVELE